MPPPPLPPPPFSLRLFWCHQCRRPVAIHRSLSAAFCPRCFDHFIHDLDFPLISPPPPQAGFLFDFSSPHIFPTRPPFRLSQLNLQLPPPPPPLPPPSITPHNLDVGDYFSGPNIDGLVEELTQNDRPGPPPAPRSAIDALPTVFVTEAHLRGGSECPVCKEEFVVGEEAREMPCRHVYHSDCIVPWLRLHNSCPVCRFQLSGGESAAGDESRARSGNGGSRRRRRQVVERWSPFALLPSFRGSHPQPGWDRRYGGDRREHLGGDPTDSPAGNHVRFITSAHGSQSRS
ncbi:E3 ubiquitin-protein ligase RING1-like [Platanthera zijinensis]|uniref:RING-type E3 ubiquitin transferase n=1 Tax=Platanthera zijinensis TaxID=2320716 RepID=A0AAP0AZA3_9ASPA